VEKQHFHGHRKRLRERFLKGGLDPFADYEAVELLLTLAIPYKDVKLAAKAAVERFGSLRGVLDAPLEELRKIPGIGEVGPVAFRIIRETANRYLQQKSQEAFSLSDEKIGLGAEESRVNEGLRRLSRKAVANAIRREEDQ
jgi:DNA repair protein RadC